MLSLFQNLQQTPAKPGDTDELGQLPIQGSEFAESVDGLYYFVTWVSIFFFALICAVLLYSVIKYRRKTLEQPAASNVTHNTPLEVVWTVIPLIIVMVIFAWGWRGSMDMTVIPNAASENEYKIEAVRWSWSITHPEESVGAPVMYAVVGKPLSIVMTARDVLHSLYIPGMRIKRDAVPGRYQVLHFTPTRLGEYRIFCTEYCGTDHSTMRSTLYVVSQEEYDETPWNTRPEKTADISERAAYGKQIWNAFNKCNSCHSIDGTVSGYPSWKDLWGSTKKVTAADGSEVEIKVDRDYILESIRNPAAKLSIGNWQGVMSGYPESALPEEDIDLYLIPFLASLQSDKSLRGMDETGVDMTEVEVGDN